MRFKKAAPAFLLALSSFVGAAEAGDPASRFNATALTPDSTYSTAKSTSGARAQTDPALLGRTDSTPVNVLIKYDYDATASYAAASQDSRRRARRSPARS